MTWNRSMMIGNGGGLPPGLPPNSTIYEVQESEASAARRYHIGFASAAVAAGSQVTVTASPQVLFRPERLVIPSQIATRFAINNIIVGNRSQLTAAGLLPGMAFSEVAIGTGLLLDTSQPGVDVILIVTNVSAVTTNFAATFIGAVVGSAP